MAASWFPSDTEAAALNAATCLVWRGVHRRAGKSWRQPRPEKAAGAGSTSSAGAGRLREVQALQPWDARGGAYLPQKRVFRDLNDGDANFGVRILFALGWKLSGEVPEEFADSQDVAASPLHVALREVGVRLDHTLSVQRKVRAPQGCWTTRTPLLAFLQPNPNPNPAQPSWVRSSLRPGLRSEGQARSGMRVRGGRTPRDVAHWLVEQRGSP